MQNLNRAQSGAVDHIENVIREHALEKEVTGAASEQKGSSTGANSATGKGWQHAEEMKDSVRAPTSAVNSIQGSLRNPNLDGAARDALLYELKRAQITLQAFQKVLGEGSL